MVRRSAGASRSLDDLTRRIGMLWGAELHVSPALRQTLVDELHQLGDDVERLVVQAASDRAVAIDEIRACQQRYLWLRERWAAPPPEGRAA